MRLASSILFILFLLLPACGRSVEEGRAPQDRQPLEADRERPAQPAKARPRIPDREEQQRRSEAVRRAAEELALRGVDTTDYLMNLVAEEDAYRVAFVKRSGRRLKAQIRVQVRREDFEILSIDGLGDGGS